MTDHLKLATVDNGGGLGVLDLALLAAGGFNGFDDSLRFVPDDGSEDDVLAVQPAGHHGCDEELRAVTVLSSGGSTDF